MLLKGFHRVYVRVFGGFAQSLLQNDAWDRPLGQHLENPLFLLLWKVVFFYECEGCDENVFRGSGDGSDAYNLFTGLQHADTLAGSETSVTDLAKALTVEHVNQAVAALEERGYRDNLVMFIHPKVALRLRNDLASKGLESISSDVLRTGEVNAIFGLKKVNVTTHLEKRNYAANDTTKVSDVVICHARDAGVGGYRRLLRVERDRDVEAGLTKVAASIRFAWKIARTDVIHIIKNALAE